MECLDAGDNESTSQTGQSELLDDSLSADSIMPDVRNMDARSSLESYSELRQLKTEEDSGARSIPPTADSRLMEDQIGGSEPPAGVMEDLCPVCNDKVSGYHYGLQTCESCKGFFKRSVQNQKRYACIENQMCIIDKAQRKRCPYCRFQKCLSVGMKLEAVRADRMRGGRNKFGPIYRRDRALRRQMRAQMQSDVDFKAVAQAAVSATLPRVDDSRMYSVSQMSSASGSEEVDIKPNISELSGFSATSSGGGAQRFSSNFAAVRMPASDVRSSVTTTSSSMSQNFGSYQQTVESKGNSYMQDPLKGLSGMASAIVNQFIQQCDLSLASGGSGTMQTQVSAQSAAVPAISSRQMSNVASTPRQLCRTVPPTASPASYSCQPVEPVAVHRERPGDSLPRYTDIGQGYPVVPLISQKLGVSMERRNSPNLDVLHMSSLESSIQRQVVQPSAPTTSADISLIAEDELQASRVPLTLQLISDLRHSTARLGSANNERLRRLADELLQQTPSRAGLEGNTSLEDAIRWAVALACRVCDQALFLLVEWARQAHFFRQLLIEDQMKLLESCWSELLLLDTLYKQLEHNETHRILMITGHFMSIDLLERIGLSSFCDQLQDLVRQIRCLKLDTNEYTCLRFIILLNPDVPGLTDAARVEQFRGEVSAALLDYCSLMSLTACGGGGGSANVNDEEQVTDKFGQMLLELSEIKLASMKIEEFVYQHYLNGTLSDSHLLVEMLLSSRQ